ncbi:7887_t:CDS:1, partial [Funneliformis caledonium]
TQTLTTLVPVQLITVIIVAEVVAAKNGVLDDIFAGLMRFCREISLTREK